MKMIKTLLSVGSNEACHADRGAQASPSDWSGQRWGVKARKLITYTTWIRADASHSVFFLCWCVGARGLLFIVALALGMYMFALGGCVPGLASFSVRPAAPPDDYSAPALQSHHSLSSPRLDLARPSHYPSPSFAQSLVSPSFSSIYDASPPPHLPMYFGLLHTGLLCALRWPPQLQAWTSFLAMPMARAMA